MDIARFDALLRSLSVAGSRRRALVALLGGLTASSQLTAADAGKKGRKKRRKRRRKHNEAPPFCAGKNSCGDFSNTCQRSGAQCNCLVNAASGESSCLDVATSRFAITCEDCTPEETCVDLRPGAGACSGTSFFCFKPCPDPL